MSLATEAGHGPHGPVDAAEDTASSHVSTPPTELETEGLAAEHLEQIWKWNTPLPPTLRSCMHQLIAQQAGHEPDRPAVDSWDGTLTYGEVELYSTRLARHLVSLGVGPGCNVPLCFEKSRWTVVAVLAIMKAGGTFALTDPSQPEGRLRTIVEQTGARHILTSTSQESLGVKIAPQATLVVVPGPSLDTDDSSTALPIVDPDLNLYIQFTSGSTGKPKGVLVTHTNYTSGALPRADLVGYQPHSRVLDFASYAFDVCIDCMLCTLANGGCLCIPSEAERVNDLSGAIRRMRVNMAHMTPSVARVLDSDILPSLEVLGLGGEAISNGDAARWSQKTKVVNAYGPSECTVGCTINNQVGRDGKEQVTIGKGVGGTMWIVEPEDHNRLVPLGIVGELLVEGPIVGPGYLGDPEKTAAVFIDDPEFLTAGYPGYAGRKGRLYKTGDLVKYDTDGSIIFVGRGDQQVKLRGQRIELAEIEHHMRDKLPPGARVAVEVIKPGGASGEPTLVAFVSEHAALVHDLSDLLGAFSPTVQSCLASMDKALSEYLPMYMVPAAYLPLKSMPLLVSAKTNRKMLREFGASLSRKDIASFAAATVQRREPSTDMERQLARIWGDVLGPDLEVSATDNFFTLGGDSLRAMKLVAAARTQRISLSVADIFGYPVLEKMAELAKPISAESDMTVEPFSLLGQEWTAASAQQDTAALCDLVPKQVEDVYPCSPLQEGLMALSAKVTEAYVAQRVIKMPDLEAAQRLTKAFEVASRSCPILRTRIVQVVGKGLMQVVVKDDFACPVIEGQNLNDFLARDRQDQVQLGKPLVRYAIVVEEKANHFVLTMHHALYDGWSMPLVVERVNRAYQSLTTERPAGFNAYIRYLCNMDREASVSYWKERLEGASGAQFPTLPYQGYQQQADSLLEHYVAIERRLGGTTVATAIRGAWGLLVASYMASGDVVFGETLTGRNAPIPGIEEMEGPMIATIPVRVQVDLDLTVGEYLQEIHEQSIRGIPHEHFGLQHIRRLSPDAREACELRTGLVLHPSADGAAPEPAADRPADALVPANDEEAAQEALKFNTYALMLVCSLDPKGFLIMASFDGNTVASPQMQRMLSQLGSLVQQFCEAPAKRLGDLQILDDKDLLELSRLSRSSGPTLKRSPRFSDLQVTDAWIVDPANHNRLAPLGAVGELVVHCLGDHQLERIEPPQWLEDVPVEAVYRTGQLAKYASDDSITLVERPSARATTAQPTAGRAARVAASTAKQRKLGQAWSRILGVPEEEIGLDDSFFLLGGDSIGAMKLVSEARAEGYELSVAQVFKNRTLYDMASVLTATPAAATAAEEEKAPPLPPFSLLDPAWVEAQTAGVAAALRPLLARPDDWTIRDAYPTRPLQKVAVNGTVRLPRYSARYELLHLEGAVDEARLAAACRALVARHEILRTVFVEAGGRCLGVVLDALVPDVAEYVLAAHQDVAAFARQLCDVDVQAPMPHGSAFVKFFLVRQEEQSPSQQQQPQPQEQKQPARRCLVLRISHAQYDEICLVGLLRELGALYDGAATTLAPAVPFSAFVHHTLRRAGPQSEPYWRELLRGAPGLSVLRPDIPLASRVPAAVEATYSIAARPRDVTVATLPTAAWALCLARRLGYDGDGSGARDVVFGEVVSGRNTDLPAGGDAVMGPTWQYVPVRVRLAAGASGMDLLEAVQHQHVASARHEGLGLAEIVARCTDWGTADTDADADAVWFDSVVHQDVYHVETMTVGPARCRTETVYPHYEPLREWKIQAFVKGDEMTLEIVTFGEWIDYAKGLLEDLGSALEALVNRPHELI